MLELSSFWFISTYHLLSCYYWDKVSLYSLDCPKIPKIMACISTNILVMLMPNHILNRLKSYYRVSIPHWAITLLNQSGRSEDQLLSFVNIVSCMYAHQGLSTIARCPRSPFHEECVPASLCSACAPARQLWGDERRIHSGGGGSDSEEGGKYCRSRFASYFSPSCPSFVGKPCKKSSIKGCSTSLSPCWGTPHTCTSI